MKPFRLVLVVAYFSIFCALFSGVGSALDQDEAAVSLMWSSQTLCQGSSVTVTVLFASGCSEELTIYRVGLHFDWMAYDSFVGLDISDNPVIIPSHGTCAFDPMIILIPEDVSVGTHSYFVGIEGFQGESTYFFWEDSNTRTLLIQDPKVEVYNELVTRVASNITEAVKATYQSSEAQSLLEQAENAYAQALSLANEENWEKAISALQNASTYLEQADIEEQNYVEAKSQQDKLLIIAGVVAVGVVAVLIIILMVTRKRKQNAPVNQPAEA
jgi:hypothetical protein